MKLSERTHSAQKVFLLSYFNILHIVSFTCSRLCETNARNIKNSLQTLVQFPFGLFIHQNKCWLLVRTHIRLHHHSISIQSWTFLWCVSRSISLHSVHIRNRRGQQLRLVQTHGQQNKKYRVTESCKVSPADTVFSLQSVSEAASTRRDQRKQNSSGLKRREMMESVAQTYILDGNVELLLEAICPEASHTDTLTLERQHRKKRTRLKAVEFN